MPISLRRENADLMQSTPPPTPTTKAPAPETPAVPKGSLDKEIIRRRIRAHIGEIKDCYEAKLIYDPNLAGRVVVQFTIAQDGSVLHAITQSSTMKNEAVEDCINEVICDWRFPKPMGGGIVIVAYPFNFTSGSPPSTD
jgi:outer membrane biosynthesis protein TonB